MPEEVQHGTRLGMFVDANDDEDGAEKVEFKKVVHHSGVHASREDSTRWNHAKSHAR